MTRSLNEVMGLAAKAARGAGAPPAQAARYGQAAVAHLCAGRSADDLERALNALPGGPVMALPVALAALCEAEGCEGFLDPNGWIDLAQSYVDALPFFAILRTGMHLQLDPLTPVSRPAKARCDAPPALLDFWTKYSARMLVPESDTSRLSGAGAGLSDND